MIPSANSSLLHPLKGFISGLKSGSSILFYTGGLHFLLALLFLLFMGLDDTTVRGENAWLKPFRFAISIFLFTWTYAWFTTFTHRFRSTFSVLNLLISLCMIIEIALISLQASRGVPSHFNVSTPIDAMVFSIMGGAIGFNAIVLGVWFILFAFFEKSKSEFNTSIIWAMILFLIGNLSGYFLIKYGWPVNPEFLRSNTFLTGWDWNPGDLRIAHAAGLHSIQILPLCMWLIIRGNQSRLLIHLIGALYLLLLLFLNFFGTVG